MSKNPAWNAYNETVRKANEGYEAEIRPIRATLSFDIAKVEKKFDDQINPLVLERKTIVQNLKDEYSDKVMAAEKKRREAHNRASQVLQAELQAAKDAAAKEKEQQAAGAAGGR